MYKQFDWVLNASLLALMFYIYDDSFVFFSVGVSKYRT